MCETDYDGPADYLLQTEFENLRENAAYAFDVVWRRIGADMPGKGVPQELIHHMHRMLLRSRMHFSVYDPVSDLMQSRSSYLYDCCAWVMTQMIETYKIQPSSGEVAFLALRLSMYLPAFLIAEPPVTAVLICPDFGTTGTILAERIKEKFSPRLRLAACINHVNLEELPSAELYLSVLPPGSRRRSVQITPFLIESDCALVSRELSRIERLWARDFLTAYLECYSGPQFFETSEGFSSREAAVRHICSRLEKKKIVDPGFPDLILRREYAADTVAYQEVAIPHACTSGVRKNTIYILKSKTPIPWGEKSVKMVIFMALERFLLEDFRYLYCLLLRFLNYPKSLAGFVAAESFSMLMEQLSNFPADY